MRIAEASRERFSYNAVQMFMDYREEGMPFEDAALAVSRYFQELDYGDILRILKDYGFRERIKLDKEKIEITEEVRIPGTDILLEKGDGIEVLSEYYYVPAVYDLLNGMEWMDAVQSFAAWLEDSTEVPEDFAIDVLNVIDKKGNRYW